MLRVKLVVVGGEFELPEIELTELPATIGRSRDNAITLPHPLVSRVHCFITECDNRLHVRDNGSLNGTFIGNQRIEEGFLNDEDLLTIGSVTFRAVYLSHVSRDCETTRIKDSNETVRVDRVAAECRPPDTPAAPITESARSATN